MKCDVLWSDVLTDSRKDCVSLVSNEHEIVFVSIDHKSNKRRMSKNLDLGCATVSVMMPLATMLSN